MPSELCLSRSHGSHRYPNYQLTVALVINLLKKPKQCNSNKKWTKNYILHPGFSTLQITPGSGEKPLLVLSPRQASRVTLPSMHFIPSDISLTGLQSHDWLQQITSGPSSPQKQTQGFWSQIFRIWGCCGAWLYVLHLPANFKCDSSLS